jgi:lipopolysaccharide O-acetyltransferase
MNDSIHRIRTFVQENGLFLLFDEAILRASRALQGWALGRRLRTSGLRIGPHSYIRGLARMKVGQGFRAGPGLWLEAVTSYKGQVFSPTLLIGEGVQVGQWVHIAATHSVEIGDHCLLGSRILITDHSHGQYSASDPVSSLSPADRPLDSVGRVVIGRNVWIGDGVVVLPGANIGEGSVIGANSVVTGNIPPLTIAAGVPTRTIRHMRPDAAADPGQE